MVMTNDMIRKKAEFFKEKDIIVHISKKNNWFANGKIISIESDFLILMGEVIWLLFFI